MAEKKEVAIRLATEGKAQIKNDFAEIGDAGVGAAQRLSRDFQRAGEDIAKSTARQNALGAKLAAVNGGYTIGRDQNAQVAAYTREMALQERQAAALRDALNPLAVAQRAYDAELATYNRLVVSGKLQDQERAELVALSGKRLDEAKRALDGHTGALSLNRTQAIVAQSAAMRFVDSIIAGQSPIRAFALEAHKLGEVVSLDDGGVAGGLAKVRALLNPTTPCRRGDNRRRGDRCRGVA